MPQVPQKMMRHLRNQQQSLNPLTEFELMQVDALSNALWRCHH